MPSFAPATDAPLSMAFKMKKDIELACRLGAKGRPWCKGRSKERSTRKEGRSRGLESTSRVRVIIGRLCYCKQVSTLIYSYNCRFLFEKACFEGDLIADVSVDRCMLSLSLSL
ncbi:unnamed protein product [Dovyalis caffra]|uniref:Uncharacterized protein n=1 Tax=Dovyalis caffra TaxID=77055 RepID=A0AAV1SG64_9ROSI|nr:unnamed protein product [Dovyalis caffra]